MPSRLPPWLTADYKGESTERGVGILASVSSGELVWHTHHWIHLSVEKCPWSAVAALPKVSRTERCPPGAAHSWMTENGEGVQIALWWDQSLVINIFRRA